MTGCAGSAKPVALSVSGSLHGGQQPVTGATIQIYEVGMTGDGSRATQLIGTTLTTSDGSGNAANSNANAGNGFNSLPAGSFTITGDYTCPSAGTEVYLVGTGGNPGLAAETNNQALAMMAALGPCGNLSSSTYVVVNELTTVGSIAALAKYMTSYSALGSGSTDASTLQAAFSLVNEYTNTSLGAVPGPTLPPSTYASSIEIETLGDALSACINSPGGVAGDGSSCGMLFTDATPAGASPPADTISAALNIVNNPTLNVCAIYSLVPATPPFLPALSNCPSSWNLPISTLTVAVSGPSWVNVGQILQYSATVTGTNNQAVTWMVNGITGGSAATGIITSTGLYTSPSTAPSGAVTIGAASVLSSTASGSESVTVLPVATGDSRTVTQPANPTTCQTLSAQFSTTQRSSPPASDDTSRLQAALTACKNTGQSVELSASGSNNAFYSSELNIIGEGLLIDSGVTLEGNNNYSSQSELLNITGANSSLMGPGIVDGRGDLISGQPRLVQTNSANNFIAYNVTLQQAAHPNLYIQGGNGATVWEVTILTPPNVANADGIDIDSITNVTVIDSTIEAGDDGVAIKTNEAAASNITVINNRLYGTHGLSIGSQTFDGVTNVLFSGNYVYGTGLDGIASTDANAINIKTDQLCGGLVKQVTYQNTCITGAKHLIVINAYYGSCSGTAGTPQFQDIVIDGVYSTASVSGAYELFEGYSAAYPVNALLANISLDVTSQDSSNQYAAIALDNSNMTPTGTGITTSSFSTSGSVPACAF
jgi:polygalacturonase